ncbi:Uncharacterized protein GBIM_18376 [Gryllus bimaculatus]|nr:Uncharacterized protein GBIM_18376 [Gryllus bimaculatus]
MDSAGGSASASASARRRRRRGEHGGARAPPKAKAAAAAPPPRLQRGPASARRRRRRPRARAGGAASGSVCARPTPPPGGAQPAANAAPPEPGRWLCCLPCYWLRSNHSVHQASLTVAMLLVTSLLVASPVLFLISSAPAGDRSRECHHQYQDALKPNGCAGLIYKDPSRSVEDIGHCCCC